MRRIVVVRHSDRVVRYSDRVVRYSDRVVRYSDLRRLTRLFNWEVVIRLALVPAVGYVLVGAAIGVNRRAAREAALAAMDAAALLGR